MRSVTPLLVALLMSGALAHIEKVEVLASLTPTSDDVRVEAQLTGQTSGLPIRGAAVEVQVSRDTGTSGVEGVSGADLLGRARLTAGERGGYTGTLTPLPAGRYVLTVVDTTYRGEAAVARRAFAFAGQPTRVEVVLPTTSTPGRYVLFALLGLLAPLLVLGVVLAARKALQQRSGLSRHGSCGTTAATGRRNRRHGCGAVKTYGSCCTPDVPLTAGERPPDSGLLFHFHAVERSTLGPEGEGRPQPVSQTRVGSGSVACMAAHSSNIYQRLIRYRSFMRTHLLTALTFMGLSLAAAATAEVHAGDTLTRIAVRHATTAQALLRANPGVNPNRLRVGAALRLPAASTRSWTVRQGDTLSRIAQRTGTTLGVLLRVNRGLNPRLPLQVGQRVTLPAPATARAAAPTAVIRTASIRVTAALPVQGRVTTPYGPGHPGLDLAAPAGTPIRAALSGSVVESRFDGQSGWGWTIVIDHGDGFTTRYSHNSANLVRVGARVGAGDVIARVGSTGKSTGAHVDYRLYRRGQAIDPSSVL